MQLISLTYTSFASLDVTAEDVAEIHRSARENNALDGITGLLIFNGTHFLQVIEGSEDAIDDLVERLRRDPRHRSIELRDRRSIEQRCFKDWSMELVHVKTRFHDAQETITKVLPTALPDEVSGRIMAMVAQISTTVELPD